jgi:hypothetical protein
MTEAPMTKPFGDSGIGDWSLFGYWNLVIGYSRRYGMCAP